MPLARGQRLGPYEVLDPIAAGGMGEVYRARDTRLDRIVALKVSAEGFGDRFHREAKSIASLNHPHICTLHDVGNADGIEYLVMEYIEGKPLRGPLTAAEAMRLGAQIADALDAAHRKGITHRDLKPANVLLTRSGVKVLDFGLAKVEEPASPGADSTMTQALTGEGAILGTLPYMAPEQVEGKRADARTDLWALGLLLYEMATGERAFAGQTQASLIASILSSQPPALERIGSPDLVWVVRRCLAKEPDDRWQTARDLRQGLLRETAAAAPVRSPRPWVWGFAGLAAGAMVALGFWLLRPAPAVPFLNVSLSPQDGSAMTMHGFDLSPDGRQVVFVAIQGGVQNLWLRNLDSGLAKPLEGTDGASLPFWSPDGKSIGFFAPGMLKRVDAAGGPARVITRLPFGRGAAWSRSGVILFSKVAGGPLYRVSASGGDAVAATAVDHAAGEVDHSFPQFLPEGRQFLYYSRHADPAKNGLVLALLEESGVSSPGRRILSTGSRGVFAAGAGADGWLLFVKDSIVMAQGFRPSTGKLVGEAVATPATGLVAQSGFGGFVPMAASSTGLLAFQTGAAGNQLIWANRKGEALKPLGPPNEYVNPRLSPDGRRLLVAQSDGQMGKLQLWLFEVDQVRSTRLTFGLRDYFPVWSNGGGEFIFTSSEAGHQKLYRKALGGGSEAALLGPPASGQQLATDWSRNGEYVIYSSLESITGDGIMVLPMRNQSQPFRYLEAQFSAWHGQFSPESPGPPKWVAYTSDESGLEQIYVQAFEGKAASGSRMQVTSGGGKQPRWRDDGREIFFLTPDGKMMAAPVRATARGLEFGAPVFLFETRLQSTSRLRYSYDVTRDGNHFVLVTEYQSPSSNRINVLVNWEAGLRR